MIAPLLWIACDFILQFSFTFAHTPGKMNTATDFLSRLEMDPKEKLSLKFREDVTIKPIAVNMSPQALGKRNRSFLIPHSNTRP